MRPDGYIRKEDLARGGFLRERGRSVTHILPVGSTSLVARCGCRTFSKRKTEIVADWHGPICRGCALATKPPEAERWHADDQPTTQGRFFQ